jgi:hypothetical protein
MHTNLTKEPKSRSPRCSGQIESDPISWEQSRRSSPRAKRRSCKASPFIQKNNTKKFFFFFFFLISVPERNPTRDERKQREDKADHCVLRQHSQLLGTNNRLIFFLKKNMKQYKSKGYKISKNHDNNDLINNASVATTAVESSHQALPDRYHRWTRRRQTQT